MTDDAHYVTENIYSEIDPIINEWAKKYGLKVLTMAWDYQVRLVNMEAEDWSIAINSPSETEDQSIKVVVWNKDKKKIIICLKETLAESLEDAFLFVQL